MQIIGGIALIRAVQLETTDFSAKAWVNSEGEISGSYQVKSKLRKQIAGWQWCPKTIKLALMLLMKVSPWVRMVIILGVIGSPFLLTSMLEEGQVVTDTWYIFAPKIIVLVLMVYLMWKVRGFHAAEHMAIGAYEKHGAFGLSSIAQEPRFHPKCGGRMIFPFLLVFLLTPALSPYLPQALAGLLPLFLIELILWTDKLIGFDNLRITNGVSRLLQDWITTRPPNQVELAVGREALRQLLIAHGEPIPN